MLKANYGTTNSVKQENNFTRTNKKFNNKLNWNKTQSKTVSNKINPADLNQI